MIVIPKEMNLSSSIGLQNRRLGLPRLLFSAVVLSSMVSVVVLADDTTGPTKEWRLLYEEDFASTSFNDVNEADWELDDYSQSFDDIMDDPGRWYQNDYGSTWITEALGSFSTYRKEFQFGKDGWLTASMSARDWNKDGIIEDPPSLYTKDDAAFMEVPDHTGGVIFRNTKPLPDEYRIEYKLKTVDFGGKRGGTIEYDGRINGYNQTGCKSQHPWGEGSNTKGWPEGWTGTAESFSDPCLWQGVREGRYAYNGFHFMTIVDFQNPAPRNNHFWHYRRKVLMDSFSIHPDRVEGGGFDPNVCDSNTKEYYKYSESNFNTVNMWISGLPNWKPGKGGLTGNSQWFLTDCNGGVAKRGVESAAELLPERMGDDGEGEFYTFAIERNTSGYTLEASGNFARVGEKTIRFFRPFEMENGDDPIWHYNTNADGGYDGKFNQALVQDDNFGAYTWPDQWASDSAFPDYFVIGDLYTNVYEGSASVTDFKLYGWGDATTTEPPTTQNPTMVSPSISQNPSTRSPTLSPTTSPSRLPSEKPSETPTTTTYYPSETPTNIPTQNPSTLPSKAPTDVPSKSPTDKPSNFPSNSPSQEPTTESPSQSPTEVPTASPSDTSGAASVFESKANNRFGLMIIGLCEIGMIFYNIRK